MNFKAQKEFQRQETLDDGALADMEAPPYWAGSEVQIIPMLVLPSFVPSLVVGVVGQAAYLFLSDTAGSVPAARTD